MFERYNTGILKPGQIVRMRLDGPPYRVQSSAPARALCVPLRGTPKTVRTEKGAVEFESLSAGVNISQRAYVEVIPEEELAELERKRNARMEEKTEEPAVQPVGRVLLEESSTKEEDNMSASAIPVASAKQREKVRKAAKASRTAAIPRKLVGAAARSKANGKKPKTVRKCFCGCGEETMSYFAPGHDGRFHGLMKKLARGDVKPSDVRKTIAEVIGPFKKVGEGWRPSKDYRGNLYKAH